MHPFRYLFITDDFENNVFGTVSDPTPTDLDHAETGILTIVRLADGHYFDRNAKWQPLRAGELGSAEIDGVSTKPFHASAAQFEQPAPTGEDISDDER